MYKYNSSLKSKIWAAVPTLIGACMVFVVVRILMIYIVLFNMAVQGLGQ